MSTFHRIDRSLLIRRIHRLVTTESATPKPITSQTTRSTDDESTELVIRQIISLAVVYGLVVALIVWLVAIQFLFD